MKQNKFIVPIILIIILTIVIFIGLTYAYFDLTIKAENSSTMTIGGAEISANFVSTNAITIEEALPSDSPIGFKDFSIITKNTSNNSYKLYLKTIIYNNTFIDTENDGVLYYDIYSGTNHDTLVQTKTLFPTISKGKAILKELTIPAKTNTTTQYRLNLYFPESDKVQNKNGDLLLNAQITVENNNETSTTVPALPLASYLSINSSSESFNTSNGLEIDDTIDKNIRYVGASPKNYVEFGNTGELWRIVGVFNVKDSTGKIERKIKLVRDESLGSFSWDATGNNNNGFNDWTEADLMSELNGDYLDTTLTANKKNWYNSYWDSSTNKPVFRQTGEFNYTKVIKSNYQNMISESVWNIGGNTYTGLVPYPLPLQDQYTKERGTITYQSSRPTVWTGKVGLIYASDYGYASTNGECHENLRVGATYDKANNNWAYSNGKCKIDNWLAKNSWYWTLSPYSGRSDGVFAVGGGGAVAGGYVCDSHGVWPAVFLKSDILFISGTGEKTNPYHLG